MALKGKSNPFQHCGNALPHTDALGGSRALQLAVLHFMHGGCDQQRIAHVHGMVKSQAFSARGNSRHRHRLYPTDKCLGDVSDIL